MNERVIALIPAFNEAAHIAAVVTKARPHVDKIIVIDDGSKDQTAQAAESAGAAVVRHDVNRGKGAAMVTGLRLFAGSDAEFAVLLDADGQHDASEIPKFVEAARQSCGAIVIGTRMNETHDMPLVRLWTNQFTSWITSKLAGQKIPDCQCGFRLLRRSVLGDIKLSEGRFETETEMLIQAGRAGHDIVSVPIRTIYEGQRSHINPLRDTVRFFRLVGKYWQAR
jgi:glycosyltransferase involved in cell wall biosynthesis